MSGLTERVIENWLTSADERSYQRSFVAILLRSGHSVLYVSPHSSLEHGKDIVTIAPDGALCAYQLKVGDIGTTEWRGIQGEVIEACRTPFRDLKGRSSSRVRRPDRVYLVLTGRVSDPVRDKLALLSEENAEAKYARIDLVEIDDLVRDFTVGFESFVPSTTGGAAEVLRLAAQDGRGPADRGAICSLFDNIVGGAGGTKTRVRRALSDLVVAADFVGLPFMRAQNYVSVLDVWTLAAAHVLRIEHTRAQQWTSDFLDIIAAAVGEAADALWESTIGLTSFSTGRMGDDFLIDARNMLIVGYLGAVVNYRTIMGAPSVKTDSAALFELAHRPHFRVAPWSEGAWGPFLNLLLAIRHSQAGFNWSIGLAKRWLELVTPALGQPGLRDPYFTIEDWFEQLLGESGREEEPEQWVSYTLESALHFLARRGERRIVADRWKRLSHIDRIEYVPDDSKSLLHWNRQEDGLLVERPFPVTGSWSVLRQEALQHRPTAYDPLPWLVPFAMCAYPHRVSTAMSGALDFLTAPASARSSWRSEPEVGSPHN